MEEIMQRFVEQAPVAVMVRATLARTLADTTLNSLFERTAQVQYTKDLTFSTLVKLMAKVTFGTHDAVHAAYRHTAGIPVSLTAVYDKLQRLETAVTEALVVETAQAMRPILDALPGLPRRGAEPISGLRLRTLDGNFLAGTDHRLACLRESGAAALPGMSLVVREGRSGLLTDLIPCEDAYTNERSLADRVLPLVAANDLWLADRNFCTMDYRGGIPKQAAFFLVRHHAGTKLVPLTEEKHIGRNDGGVIYEQTVQVGWLPCRCLIIRLDKPLRDGTTAIRLLTNVPVHKAGAKRLAALYRTRWQIETAFQELTVNLCCEVNALGYPKAALFAFGLAVVAYNVLVVIQAALRSGKGRRRVQEELSSYHMAAEVARVAEGMAIALPESCWQGFVGMTDEEFARWLHETVQGLSWKRYRKNKRGPKKETKVKRTRRGAHRSTAREIQSQQK
jgi:hypothetical protein